MEEDLPITPEAEEKGKLMSRLRSGLIVTIFLIAVYVLVLFLSIEVHGRRAEPEPSDVAIILGAAVWPTGPSPALLSRIAEGARLYHEGYVSYLIPSGGLGLYPPTEAEAMTRELQRLGVPADRIFQEPRATSTWENLRFSQALMQAEGWESAVVVSDVFHMKRALRMADDLGIPASGSPTRDSVLHQRWELRFRYTLREVLAYTQYRLGGA